jgi:hypothetical protein
LVADAISRQCHAKWDAKQKKVKEKKKRMAAVPGSYYWPFWENGEFWCQWMTIPLEPPALPGLHHVGGGPSVTIAEQSVGFRRLRSGLLSAGPR